MRYLQTPITWSLSISISLHESAYQCQASPCNWPGIASAPPYVAVETPGGEPLSNQPYHDSSHLTYLHRLAVLLALAA